MSVWGSFQTLCPTLKLLKGFYKQCSFPQVCSPIIKVYLSKDLPGENPCQRLSWTGSLGEDAEQLFCQEGKYSWAWQAWSSLSYNAISAHKQWEKRRRECLCLQGRLLIFSKRPSAPAQGGTHTPGAHSEGVIQGQMRVVQHQPSRRGQKCAPEGNQGPLGLPCAQDHPAPGCFCGPRGYNAVSFHFKPAAESHLDKRKVL